MSKRNLKLLIALVVIMLMVVLSYFFLGNKPTETTTETTGGGDNFFADLLNFGNSKKPATDNGSTPADVSGYVPPAPQVMEKMKLVKISSMPISGYAVFNQERFTYVPDVKPVAPGDEGGDETVKPVVKPTAPTTEKIPTLRYVAKENGNIFQTFVDTISERKFSNTLIPGVHEAYFGNNGEAVIMRYLKSDGATIATWGGVLPKEVIGSDSANPNKITGSFLPDNITDVSVSPEGNKLFYLFNSKDGAVGISANTSGTNKAQIYNGPYTEWLSQSPNAGTVTLTTKASFDFPGYMYTIDQARKDFKKVLGNIPGLLTLTSPNTRNVLYSNNRMSLSVYNTETKESKPLSVRTLAEKCAWGNGSDFVYCAVPKFISSTYSYPDSWYQGEVSFSDDIWKINVAEGTAQIILDPLTQTDNGTRNPETIDGVKLSLSSDGKYLFFVNNIDSYLWGLELE